MHMDTLNTIIHWIVLLAAFLLLTYFFRDRVTLEGFWGHMILLFLLTPMNVIQPFRNVVCETLYPVSVIALSSQGNESAATPDDGGTPANPQGAAERQKSMLYMAFLIPVNILLIFVWSKLLPGLTITGRWAPVIFASIFSVCALGLSLAPLIPTASFFGG